MRDRVDARSYKLGDESCRETRKRNSRTKNYPQEKRSIWRGVQGQIRWVVEYCTLYERDEDIALHGVQMYKMRKGYRGRSVS